MPKLVECFGLFNGEHRIFKLTNTANQNNNTIQLFRILTFLALNKLSHISM